jgi:hypothetical protein
MGPRTRWWRLSTIILIQKSILQLLQNQCSILQIVLLWIVVPHLICFIYSWILAVMAQQSQVVMHIDQVLCSLYIQPVPSDIVDETVCAPTPLC